MGRAGFLQHSSGRIILMNILIADAYLKQPVRFAMYKKRKLALVKHKKRQARLKAKLREMKAKGKKV